VQQVPALQLLFPMSQAPGAASQSQNLPAASIQSEPGTGPSQPDSRAQSNLESAERNNSNEPGGSEAAANIFTPIISNLVNALSQPISASSGVRTENPTATLLNSASTLFAMVNGALQNQQAPAAPSQQATSATDQPAAPSTGQQGSESKQSEDQFGALRASAGNLLTFLSEATQQARPAPSVEQPEANADARPQNSNQASAPQIGADENTPRPAGQRNNSLSALQAGASTLLAYLNTSSADQSVPQANPNPVITYLDSSRRREAGQSNESKEAEERMRRIPDLD